MRTSIRIGSLASGLCAVAALTAVMPAAAATPSASPSASPSPSVSLGTSASPTPDPTASDTAVPAASAAGSSPSPSPSPSSTPVTGYGPGTLTAMTLPVQDSGRSTRQVWVWRPPGVADSPLLPVVYLLHGQYETPRTPFAHGIAGVLTKAFAAGTTPFELVVPDGVSAVRSDDEWADAADGADHLESFVGQETVRAVEGAQRRPRSLRAIAGFSMGGYGAAVMGARQSPLFGQLVALAGYYHPDDPQGALGTNSTYRYVHFPAARASQYAGSRVLLLDCTADASDPVFAGELVRMRNALASTGHAPGSRISSGTHSWGWATSQLPLVATFLAQGWGRG